MVLLWRGVDCGGSGEVLTSFAFIVRTGLCPIWCVLIGKEFVSNGELSRVRELFESQE